MLTPLNVIKIVIIYFCVNFVKQGSAYGYWLAEHVLKCLKLVESDVFVG